MEVVGWSPSEQSQDSDMFELPPQVESWSGAEDGDHTLYAGPSSPSSSSPRPESPTVYHHRRLKDPEHVPRPRNAFIIYRCDFTVKYLANGGSERAFGTEKLSLSRRAGEAWRNEDPETKRRYKNLADEERARHRADHPDYRFRPKRQKHAAHPGRKRSSKKRATAPHGHSTRSTGPASATSFERIPLNDPLQIQTITVSSALPQPRPSRQSTPDFFHGYGSTTPVSPCSPLSPVDDIVYMPRPTIATGCSDSLLSYSTGDSQYYGYPKDPLAPLPDNYSFFEPTLTQPDPMPSYPYPPLAAVASSLAGWDGNGQSQKEDMASLTPNPSLQYELEFTNNPFVSLPDESMTYFDMPFGSDPMSVQSDMDAYRMGLREYGITPASNL